jgi:phosphate transport system protein
VATDLRFVVSVLRVLSDLERVGDLSLRVAKQAPDHDALRAGALTFDILLAVCDDAIERFRKAQRAWAEMDLALATDASSANREMEALQERLMLELLRVGGDDAARIAVATFAVGRALERIGDHAAVIGTRIRYLITGDPAHLAAEVR